MKNTVKDWVEHIEIAMGFKQGDTSIGTISWTRKIYKDFCSGKASFGANGTNAMEAVLVVIKANDSSKYQLALTGLRKTIEQEREKGRPLAKMAKMFERMGGDPIV